MFNPAGYSIETMTDNGIGMITGESEQKYKRLIFFNGCLKGKKKFYFRAHDQITVHVTFSLAIGYRFARPGTGAHPVL